MSFLLTKPSLTSLLFTALAFNAVAGDTVSPVVDISPYIVNGSDANASDYPSFVSLFYDAIEYNNLYSTSPYCGGTLLNEQYVLTAAHCIYNNDDAQLLTMVVPGLQNESDYLSAQKQRVVEIYHPSNYDNRISQLLANDIAILKLESAISVGTAIVQPLTQSYRSTQSVFTTVGHGDTRSYYDAYDRLQKVNLTWVDNATCAGAFSDGSQLTDKQVCFTGDYSAVTDLLAGTCQGDSGGPIYWDNNGVQTQVGITSFGPVPCGDTNRDVTAVFTEIADYSDWITRVLNGQETPNYTSTDSARKAYLIGQGYTINAASSGSSSSGGSGGGALSWTGLMLLFVFGWQRRGRR
ncbi:trypsin-like serine protease [Vibrio sp. 10N.222.51.C12]|uniref:S1 family peptidase n=1 Tax=unclassified Vibrio TaxID=2614977 RepID=UPI000C83E14D|nr:trypsin-like serine protease [Vibrio sp. 10N.286.48.B7]PMH79349.1 hypothetical protein BCU58_05670 [Vibrio sp. 10N.286.48.B7]